MESKLKIAIVVSHPIQHFCPQYVSLSKKKDINLKVFFASALGYKKYVDKNFNKEISWNNLHLNQFDHVFLNGETVISSDQYIDAPSLESELNKYTPSLVIIYGYFQKLQRRAHRWAKTNNTKIAYISDSELRHKRNPIKEWLKYFFIKRYFSKVDYFLSVGNANESFYKYYGVSDDRMIRMHFPIDINLYERSYAEKNDLRKMVRDKYSIGEDETVISVVGKLVPWKNQEQIIDALLLLEKETIYLKLFIIGSGNIQERLEQKAANLKHSKVYFTGFIDTQYLPSFYAASDIYIHPALVEPHSIAVSEAIYMGCPVILSNTCGSYGADDDVQENKNGYIFENINQLLEKIKLLLSDKEKIKKFGLYSHEIAEKFQKRSHKEFLSDLEKRFFNAEN